MYDWNRYLEFLKGLASKYDERTLLSVYIAELDYVNIMIENKEKLICMIEEQNEKLRELLCNIEKRDLND